MGKEKTNWCRVTSHNSRRRRSLAMLTVTNECAGDEPWKKICAAAQNFKNAPLEKYGALYINDLFFSLQRCTVLG